MMCVIFGVFVSIFNLLILPLDFVTGDKSENPYSIGIEIDTESLLAISIFLSLLSCILNFFFLKYYRYHNPYNHDKEDLEIDNRIIHSAKFVGKFVGISLVLIIPLTFIYGGRLELDYIKQIVLPNKLKFSEIGSSPIKIFTRQTIYSAVFTPAFLNVLLGPLILVGGFVFYIIGGYGLATVPLKFFTIWVKRPKKPDPEDMVMSDIILREMSEKSIELLKEIIEKQEEVDEIRLEPDHDKNAMNIKIDTLLQEIITVQKELVLFEEIYEIKKKKS